MFLPLPPPRVIEQTSDADAADIALFEEPEKNSETIFQLHANNYLLREGLKDLKINDEGYYQRLSCYRIYDNNYYWQYL